MCTTSLEWLSLVMTLAGWWLSQRTKQCQYPSIPLRRGTRGRPGQPIWETANNSTRSRQHDSMHSRISQHGRIRGCLALLKALPERSMRRYGMIHVPSAFRNSALSPTTRRFRTSACRHRCRKDLDSSVDPTPSRLSTISSLSFRRVRLAAFKTSFTHRLGIGQKRWPTMRGWTSPGTTRKISSFGGGQRPAASRGMVVGDSSTDN